jgi:hypothetical protein
VILFPDRTEATEGPLISYVSDPAEAYILDGLRVPIILDPALLDLIDDSLSTGGFTL